MITFLFLCFGALLWHQSRKASKIKRSREIQRRQELKSTLARLDEDKSKIITIATISIKDNNPW